MKTLIGKVKWIQETGARLDSSFHLGDGRKTRKILEDSPLGTKLLSEFSSDIFYGGRARRNYVENKEKGVSFMGSSDMLKSDFESLKLVSKKLTKDLTSSMLKEGWTMISRSGTIGNTNYTTKDFIGKAASEHIIRVVPNDQIKSGYLYSFLSSKYGYALMTQGTFGAVIRHIEPEYLAGLPIPIFDKIKQQKIHDLITEASDLRVEANKLLRNAQKEIKTLVELPDLNKNEFEYFGNHSHDREVAVFQRNISELSAISINAFNYSKKVEILENRVKQKKYKLLHECLDANQFFSTGSFKRLELDSPTSIKLINQSDILNLKKQGKLLARAFAKTDKLAEYGEVLIAGVGTLGEGETFCRAIFVNEELEGQLLAGEFIRMKTNEEVPSGYLFSWLSSDYGFRFIRKTQSGTKLCRPIHRLLKNIPIPILEKSQMDKIDKDVRSANKMIYDALCKENKAISLVEKEIESWQK
ncbi:methylation-associated defense system restriction endonuclease subunit S MAD5 [Flavobacterium sp. XS2P39]|uniref:methylation-associated defense system restriction endonuclease subunit S MAD5 n=1 Tax=Flavobacterium sp. XS2P39 TaxID=3401725 RepID=UPI003AAC43EF